MHENFLHYIWQHQLFRKEKLQSVNQEVIEVISPGVHNTDAGPDFLNARIIINGTIWAGNVEIHIDSSMWQQHKHHNNKAYNNVILHVVASYSKPAILSNGNIVPTMVLGIDEKHLLNYNSILSNERAIPCSEKIDVVDSFVWGNWLERLCVERIEDKTEVIQGYLETTKGNWEEVFYYALAKSFGFKTNALPFEMLARATSLKLLAKYSGNLRQLEALLYGQAGFLEKSEIEDEYTEGLKKEYAYQRKVHKLKPLEKHIWKFMRLRPSNFPTIRLAQFASLIHQSSKLFSKIIETKNLQQLRNLFECRVSDYWETHYNFNKTSKKQAKLLGSNAINSLLINTVIPLLFLYGKERANTDLCERAILFLEKLPSEKNSILVNWEHFNVKAENAAQSQALLQLSNKYCASKNCLYCQVGNAIIQRSN